MELLLLLSIVIALLFPIKGEPSKKFGEGMFNDSDAHDWWKPGNGGI